MIYKIIAIIGPSGSGKDTILNKVFERCSNELNKIVNHTTRPQRENEIDGINYHFISVEDFTKEMLQSNLIEATVFNDWFYGTHINSLDKEKINIGVFNPDGATIIYENYDNIKIYPLYIKVKDKTRLLRQLNREDDPNVTEIVRRFMADKNDFENFEEDTLIDYYELNNDTEEDLEKNIQFIQKLILDIWRVEGNDN